MLLVGEIEPVDDGVEVFLVVEEFLVFGEVIEDFAKVGFLSLRVGD